MDHLTNRSEQIISELVQENNDEQVVRLIFALLDLDQGKVQERVDLLTQLGERYVLLAMNRSLHQDPDELVRSWYEEAIASYSYAIKLIPTGGAYLHRALVYFMQNQYEKALADCKQALQLSSELSTQAFSGK